MDFYSKPYISINGSKCRIWYHFGITITLKKQFKLFGYYDGNCHNFYIYPIWFHWHKRPMIIRKNENRKIVIKKILKKYE